MPDSQTRSTRHYLGALWAALLLGSVSAMLYQYGLLFWAALFCACIGLLLAGRYVLHSLRPAAVSGWSSFCTLLASCAATLLMVEGGILISEKLSAQAQRQDTSLLTGPLLLPEALTSAAQQALRERLGVLVLPDTWKRRPVADRPRDYVWHGALHELDNHAFRRSQPWPQKRPGVFRIAVIGDSLTYGAGIDTRFTYSAVLQRLLAARHRVEVLNLGISGNQSEDTLRVLQRWVPQLQPDMVVYGVCLNDFLPSRTGEYAVTDDDSMVQALGSHLAQHSRLGSFVADRYTQYQLLNGHRVDFMDDILSDFDGYQSRFGRDLAAMADYVQGEHGLPFIGMVLHQYLNVGGRADRAARAAEAHLRAAGVDVVTSDTYFQAYDGRNLGVSRWEGHPNELAHALYASLLYPKITAQPELLAYRRDADADLASRQ